MDKGRETYREEAYELLAELESSLLELEEAPDDAEIIGRVFRAMHTIKGSGAMFGFDDIAAFTHDVETVFERVREGRIAVTKELIDLTLDARDMIRLMLDGEAIDDDEKLSVSKGFRDMLSQKAETGPAVEKTIPVIPAGNSPCYTYRIRFCPDRHIFESGNNPLLILNEIRRLGECEVFGQTHPIPELDELNPEFCYMLWDIILTSRESLNEVRDVFIFVESQCDLEIEIINETDCMDEVPRYHRVGEILVMRGDIEADEIESAESRRKRIGEILVESRKIDRGLVDSALGEQNHVRRLRQKQEETIRSSSIRVPAEKLDKLVDLVGELVTVQARLSQKAANQNDAQIVSIAEEVERLTWELRDNTMSIRMVPIGTTFNKFRRLVRDLSRDLGKETVMLTLGGETELDKTVIERLNDPLVHIIRNCIDHGIEPPDQRREKGKPIEGTIRLAAEHAGANVLIRITDDGRGLDREKILETAVRKGLAAPDVELTEREIYALLFEAGFSTAGEVTGVSGRGVGMDVVKRNVEALRGSVEIDSKPGQGTVITLKLPLTLAIIDGLLVKIRDDHFVMPLLLVDECIELMGRKEDEAAVGRHLANVRGDLVPYIILRDIMDYADAPPSIEQIVIARADGYRVGLVVDEVVGQHQTVIKSLGQVYRDAEVFSGATILADGTVALILDINRLARTAESVEAALFVQL